jgi:hypothetical protein
MKKVQNVSARHQARRREGIAEPFDGAILSPWQTVLDKIAGSAEVQQEMSRLVQEREDASRRRVLPVDSDNRQPRSSNREAANLVDCAVLEMKNENPQTLDRVTPPVQSRVRRFPRLSDRRIDSCARTKTSCGSFEVNSRRLRPQELDFLGFPGLGQFQSDFALKLNPANLRQRLW